MKRISITILCFIALLSCSQDEIVEETGTIEKITSSDVVLDYDSLNAVGFKKAKKYKVKDLPKANSAYMGFLKEDPETDYEVRFYDSHQDAIDHGTSYAEERTGEDAVVKKEKARWKEGVKDARTCAGDTHSGKTSYLSAHGAATCTTPKYFDYIIYGNMVLLCQGADSSESILKCSNIINKLTSTD